MNLHGHTRLDLIRKGKVVHRIERDITPRCPICDMELEITDKWEPGLWAVYCTRYACDLPFYFIGLTREQTLKDFYEAAENWSKKHEQR